MSCGNRNMMPSVSVCAPRTTHNAALALGIRATWSARKVYKVQSPHDHTTVAVRVSLSLFSVAHVVFRYRSLSLNACSRSTAAGGMSTPPPHWTTPHTCLAPLPTAGECRAALGNMGLRSRGPCCTCGGAIQCQRLVQLLLAVVVVVDIQVPGSLKHPNDAQPPTGRRDSGLPKHLFQVQDVSTGLEEVEDVQLGQLQGLGLIPCLRDLRGRRFGAVASPSAGATHHNIEHTRARTHTPLSAACDHCSAPRRRARPHAHTRMHPLQSLHTPQKVSSHLVMLSRICVATACSSGAALWLRRPHQQASLMRIRGKFCTTMPTATMETMMPSMQTHMRDL